MAYYLSPVFNEQKTDSNGNPLIGGKIYTYLAGTTTAAATYTSSAGAGPQANPIILNNFGAPDSPIWLLSGSSYKFVLKDANDVVVPGGTIDNITGINDITDNINDEWVLSALTPTYISGTSFSFSGDQTVNFAVGRRLKTINTAGTRYSTIATSTYATGITTITLTNDSGTLDSGLSAVYYGIIHSTNPSLPDSATVRSVMGITSAIAVASQNQSYKAYTTGGTATAFTLTPSPAITALAENQEWDIKFNAAAGATPTLSVSGTTAKSLKYRTVDNILAAITSTQVPSGWRSKVVYDGTDYIVREVANANILRGYIDGLTLSTAGSSATMSIAAGQAADSTNGVLLNLASAISKTTSAWAVGTAAGGKLSAAAIANSTWYYWYLIRRPDTGVVDVGFDVSATTPTLPTNYTQYRYIGAGLTDGSAQWTFFIQRGDKFTWGTPVLDMNNVTGAITATLQTLTVPLGRKMEVFLNVSANEGGAYNGSYFSDPDTTDVAPGTSLTTNPQPSIGGVGTAAGFTTTSQVSVITNTSAQIRHRETAAILLAASTLAWIDLRGKQA